MPNRADMPITEKIKRLRTLNTILSLFFVCTTYFDTISDGDKKFRTLLNFRAYRKIHIIKKNLIYLCECCFERLFTLKTDFQIKTICRLRSSHRYFLA